jgi:hypothetical protein
VNRLRHLAAGIAVAAAAACADGHGPVAIAPGEDACAQCRMTFAATSTAVEILAPGEAPVLFDDLECFRQFAAAHPPVAGARIVVADHRTGEWVDGPSAVVTRSSAATPMGSGLLAHATPASRDQDPAASGGQPVAWRTLLP